MKEYIDITPHKSIMKKISQTGYSIEDALAELVDNSIDARKNKLIVDIKISPEQISVADNGIGMSKSTAASSMKLGFSTKKEKLGEFGMGLKTSALSLGDKFTINTGENKTNEEFVIEYDLEDWIRNGSWSNHPIKTAKKSSDKSGTKIIIEKIKVPIVDTDITKIQKHLANRFAPYIATGEVEIRINDQKCIPNSIKLTEAGRKTISFKEGSIEVTGWYGFKLATTGKEQFGFNTFRRGRLITIHDKIGLNKKQRAKQLVGELHIEGIPITHDKRNWIKVSKEFRTVTRAIKKIIQNVDRDLKILIKGIPANPGRIEGTVRIVNSFIGRDISELSKVKPGEILVTEMTRPDLLLAIRRASAIITDLGGALCHAAIVAREFNVPCVVGTQKATSILKDGMKVIVDAEEGIIYEA